MIIVPLAIDFTFLEGRKGFWWGSFLPFDVLEDRCVFVIPLEPTKGGKVRTALGTGVDKSDADCPDGNFLRKLSLSLGCELVVVEVEGPVTTRLIPVLTEVIELLQSAFASGCPGAEAEGPRGNVTFSVSVNQSYKIK